MEYVLHMADGSKVLMHSGLPEAEVRRRHYAFPKSRRYPLYDRSHVLSAIRFFNYIEPENEQTLANAILQRMKELNMTGVTVGKANRFSKYYPGE